ncbi:MAG: hypothetical protein V7K81_06190 [Nostoc sp.]
MKSLCYREEFRSFTPLKVLFFDQYLQFFNFSFQFSRPLTQWYLRTTAQVSGDRTNNYIRPRRASSLNVAIKFF